MKTGIIDSTLREGEQAPGVNFSREQRREIIRMLVELGSEEIELGVASERSPALAELVEETAALAAGRSRISLWSRCRPADIRFARRCRPDILALSMPVSDLHITSRLGRDRQWVLTTLRESVDLARDLGFRMVSVGLEDATRADKPFLFQVVKTLTAAGAARIRLADTVGVASPGTIGNLVREVRKQTFLPLAVHTHNDFGMATANAVAALEAGAEWADATVLGLGERAGNCRLEEITGYLSLARGRPGYRPQILAELCSFVARAAGLTIPASHPVIGDSIFVCETGLHVQGLAGNPATYEPYDPARLGRSRTLLFGRKTGRRALQSRLDSLGVHLDDRDSERLVEDVRRQAAERDGFLEDPDLLALASRLREGVNGCRTG